MLEYKQAGALWNPDGTGVDAAGICRPGLALQALCTSTHEHPHDSRCLRCLGMMCNCRWQPNETQRPTFGLVQTWEHTMPLHPSLDPSPSACVKGWQNSQMLHVCTGGGAFTPAIKQEEYFLQPATDLPQTRTLTAGLASLLSNPQSDFESYHRNN